MPLLYRKENFLFLKKLLQAKPDHFAILNMPRCLYPLLLRASSSLPLRPNDKASITRASGVQKPLSQLGMWPH